MELWEMLGGHLENLPEDYCEQFGYTFDNGNISLISHLAKVDYIADLSKEDFSELVDYMSEVDPADWPDPEAIEEILYERLGKAEEISFSEGELDFAENNDYGPKVEAMLKKVISTVYRDGVARVVNTDGKPPSAENNFLMSEDGTTFQGVFITGKGPEGKRANYPFTIKESGEGKWQITY
jgi:hypothetical protein